VIEAVKSGQIKKPIIAWCIGTIAKHFSSGVQFGHAGASANADAETAARLQAAFQKAGERTPEYAEVVDEAFFRKYKAMPESTKKQIRKILDAWDDDE
jgi:succinyl-CoA synthetase alpha subunit